MKRSLLLLFALLVTAVASSYAQFTPKQMVEEWKRAKVYTKEYLDAMPADGYTFKPTPEIRSFAEQMLHLTDANYFLGSTATGKASPMGEKSAEKSIAQTKEATTKAVMDSYDFVISSLEAMTQAQLDEMTKFAGKDFTRAGVFGKAFEHQTHHRGQCTIYLRLKGVKPPQEKLV